MVALAIMAAMAGLAVPVVKTMAEVREKSYHEYQDDIGIYQLQVKLAICSIDDVTDELIKYHDADNEYELAEDDGRLLSHPGTVIYLYGIEDVLFELEDDMIVLSYSRDGRLFRWPLAYYLETSSPEGPGANSTEVNENDRAAS